MLLNQDDRASRPEHRVTVAHDIKPNRQEQVGGKVMSDSEMATQMAERAGFIAALDQSGGSTPGALRHYGIPEGAYSADEEMFRLVHEMRVRIISSPAFVGSKIIGAILFEKTMDGEAHGIPVPTYLWKKRGVVPFLKVDRGLEPEMDGVRLMKPIPGLDDLLARAATLGVYGTKMRSTIAMPSESGIAKVVRQQFEIAKQIDARGLMPIIEPEVSIESPAKANCEELLLQAIIKNLDRLSPGKRVMLKLTIPTKSNLYEGLARDPRVARVVALSGGYSRDRACELLAENHGVIASFSRALVEDLKFEMSDRAFDATLAAAVDQIHDASTAKRGTLESASTERFVPERAHGPDAV
jgi:fructose-bisphosphate aldolase class I